MLINIFDKNCAKILLSFLTSPGRNHNRKEICERTGMNNIPLDISLNKLLFLKLIKENKRIYSLNLEHNLAKDMIEEGRAFSQIPFDAQFAIIELIADISKFRHIKRIILFGSYSKLIFSERSDIDIAIITEDNLPGKKQAQLEKQIFLIKNKLSKKYKKVIEMHYLNETDLKHKKDPFIKDILRNGKILV